ncbi:MAG: hypothetical protein GDA55_01900 [Cellvibrionales bacterium]|nr:hypothetical protein [Cellvibrionales bacterium]
MSAWVRSQPKTLRPYFGAEAAGSLLDDAELVLKAGDAPVQKNRLMIDDEQMQTVAPRLYPRLSEKEINETLGDRCSVFTLVVTLRTPQMLRRELVVRHSLDEDLCECIKVPGAMLKDAKLTGLFELGMSICLAKEVDLGPGWPSQIGSWVAKKIFKVGLDRKQSTFRIIPLTEELAKRMKLPKGTFVYVDDVENMNEVHADGTACASVYVAEKICPSSGTGKSAINSLIFSEIIAAMLLAEENGIKEAEEVTSGSPLEALLKNLQPDRAMTLPEIKKLLKDPLRLRATVHDSCGLVADLEKL